MCEQEIRTVRTSLASSPHGRFLYAMSKARSMMARFASTGKLSLLRFGDGVTADKSLEAFFLVGVMGAGEVDGGRFMGLMLCGRRGERAVPQDVFDVPVILGCGR